MAIDDFSLLPLVSPVPICSSISSSPLQAKSPKGGDEHVAQPTDSVSSDVPLSSSVRVGVPMCILVCGHLKEGTSAQELWSRRGFFFPTPTIATATESLMASSSSSSVAITTAVLHETIEAGVESIVGYRFAAKDPSLAVDELTVSIEASSVSAPDQCGVLVEAATESEELLGGISEWEDVTDESIGTYSPFSLSQQFLLQWEPRELRSLDLTFQKIMLDNVLGRLKGMVKREVLKV